MAPAGEAGGVNHAFGLDPDTKKRRLVTAETYSRLAGEYEAAGRKADAARCDGVVERCVQGV